MYTLVAGRVEIEKAQRSLEASIRRTFRAKATRNIGYPGGNQRDAVVATDGYYWYWTADHKAKDVANPRRLNWFGLIGSVTRAEITVEINTTFSGRNDSVAGFFARNNETGMTYLFHSGRIGGGTTGVKKEAFLTWTGLELMRVFDSEGKVREGILVMPVTGTSATRPAVRYIQSIAEFKKAVREGKTGTADFLARQQTVHDFYQEGRGRRTSKELGKAIDYVSRHGDVVDALHAWRTAKGLKRGERLVKNVLIDLGLQDRSSLLELYEVKTSTVRGDVYTAIGQLAVHAPSSQCKRIIVLPRQDRLAKDLQDGLVRNGIELLRFELTETEAKIL